jgi:hypothetical protein
MARVKKLKEMIWGSRMPKYEGKVAENMVAKNDTVIRNRKTGCSLVTRR